jgi:hypothetical protein
MQRLFYRSNTGTAGVCSLEENTMSTMDSIKIKSYYLEAILGTLCVLAFPAVFILAHITAK